MELIKVKNKETSEYRFFESRLGAKDFLRTNFDWIEAGVMRI